ncbi:putative signal peptide protein [Puccinia sorghi]|uniref:Putative signal peptide protein n=1 Tax=Puccinia sorghi TaxID=27349 RepID=A0A0L6UGQ0_9BASI|nr:putative signal peptide protein [Puccinia sorghi]
MPWNSARSLLHNKLLAWCCCIYTMRIVCAHPYLQDVVEGHQLTPGLHSSAEDFHAPFLQYDGLNQEGFINHKQPQGSPPVADYQPGFSNSNPEWLSRNVDHDYPNTNPENGVMSTATKRQKTSRNGQLATPAPQSNYNFDNSFATGATNEEMFWPVALEAYDSIYANPSV